MVKIFDHNSFFKKQHQDIFQETAIQVYVSRKILLWNKFWGNIKI